MPQIDNYWNRFDESKNYHELLVRDGYGMQASEINELQSIVDARITRIARALFKDGDVVRDAQILVNAATGQVKANAGEVFLEGRVWSVPARVFTIPVHGAVTVGVRLVESIISEMEDPGLRNPAIGHATAGEPGAWRKKIVAEWSYDTGAGQSSFYPVYPVDDGVQMAKEAPPALDSFNQVIARYDRDSTGGGTYAIEGLTVAPGGDMADGRQIWHLKEGRARINGFGVEIATSRRIIYDAQPDLREIEMEIVDATSAAGTSSGQRINVAHPPIKDILSLKITVEETFTLTHGAYLGCTDDLPVTGVISILEVKQGGTVYPASAWNRKGDAIDWSPVGDEPSPGSTYAAKARYLKNYGPLNLDLDGFTVKDAVNGTQILFSYRQMLQRYDRLAMNVDGITTWIKGVASEKNPVQPNVPANLLPLATVWQNWRPDRELYNDSPRVVAFETFEALSGRVDYIAQEVARNRLEMDASTREAGAKAGIFVDPLMDDDMRDQGISQTGAIVDGELTLAVSEAKALNFSADVKVETARAWTLKVITEQPLRTGDMQVNPYQAFAPMAGKVALNPAIDQWTETQTMWLSDITRQITRASGNVGRRWYAVTRRTTSTSTAVNQVGATTAKLRWLRQIDINYTVSGFGPGEKLQSATFDGINLNLGALTANASGVISGKFRIPANVPAGSKAVIFKGQGGSVAAGVFTGQGQLTVKQMRKTITTTTTNYWTYVDPLAQTFVTERDLMLGGVDLMFTAKGGPVRVQLREVDNGVPTLDVLSEVTLAASSILTNGNYTRAQFPCPVALNSGTEYAFVVLCDDAATKLSLAELGKFDKIHQRWVTQQPYAVGVMLSSSNAATWTAHQDKDLTFRLLEADFGSAAARTINLGNVSVTNATDLVFMAVTECPSSDCFIDFTLTLPNGQKLVVAEGQPISLGQKLSGSITCAARLSGSRTMSPVLHPGAQLLSAQTQSRPRSFMKPVSHPAHPSSASFSWTMASGSTPPRLAQPSAMRAGWNTSTPWL